jgi:sphingomyelin phosphodiesterase
MALRLQIVLCLMMSGIVMADLSDFLTCQECRALVKALTVYLKEYDDITFIEDIGIDYCIYSKIQSPDVCTGIIREFFPEIVTILKQDPPATFVCQHLRLCPSNTSVYRHFPPTSKMTKIKTTPTTPTTPTMKNSSIGYILQLSDIHFDPFYQVGSSSRCSDPLCCRSGTPTNLTDRAGPYGSIGCDSNEALINSFFTQAHQLYPQPDLILWTGDAPCHDIWNQSLSRNQNASRAIAAWVNQYFPGIPVVVAIGNHENFPSDQDPGPINNTNLIEGLLEAWNDSMSPEEISTFSYAGYYSHLVPPSKLRIISLNSDLGMSTNLWLLLAGVNSSYLDLGNQLAWLNQTLALAQQNQESVWIISHASIGDESMISTYSEKFYSIISAYPGLIRAQFHGHTHYDSFRVVTTSQVPDHLEFINPSLTPFGGNFPALRWYQYSRNTFEILDYWQYFLNLTAINLENATATWQFSYQATAEYGYALTPSNWLHLATELETDSTILLQFCQNYFARNSNPYCSDAKVLRDLQCQVNTFSYQQYLNCMR